MRMVACGLALFALVGCGAPETTAGGVDARTRSDAGPFFPEDPPPDFAVRVRVEGTTVGLDELPLAGVQVKLCGAMPCREARSDGSGHFAFDDVYAGFYSLSALPPTPEHAGVT